MKSNGTKVVLVILTYFATCFVECKIYERCELRKIFLESFPPDQINDWLCLAYHESRFDSSAIGNTNPDGSKDLGIFQISEKWWCKWNKVSIVSCDVKCNKFLDKDVSDDIRCVKKIFKEHNKLQGNGFKAWTAWSSKCAGNNLRAFSKGCLPEEKDVQVEAEAKGKSWPLSPDFKPGIVAPFKVMGDN